MLSLETVFRMEISDSTRAQQHAFKDDVIVAAVPIRMRGDSLADDPVIGVLSVISSENDGAYTQEDGTINNPGIEQLKTVADKIGIACDGLQGLY